MNTLDLLQFVTISVVSIACRNFDSRADIYRSGDSLLRRNLSCAKATLEPLLCATVRQLPHNQHNDSSRGCSRRSTSSCHIGSGVLHKGMDRHLRNKLLEEADSAA